MKAALIFALALSGCGTTGPLDGTWLLTAGGCTGTMQLTSNGNQLKGDFVLCDSPGTVIGQFDPPILTLLFRESGTEALFDGFADMSVMWGSLGNISFSARRPQVRWGKILSPEGHP